MDEHITLKKPENISLEQAATLGVASLVRAPTATEDVIAYMI